MKKIKITFIIGCLLFYSASLFAQNKEGHFNLKEGDWFEIEVKRSYISPQVSHIMDPVQTQLVEETCLLNYRLQKQLPTGNQLYNICLEHLKGTRKSGKYFLGYDSYYPEFEENKTSPEFKNQYNLEVKPNGEIAYFKCNRSNKSKVIYNSVNSSYGRNNSVSYAEAGSDSLIVKAFSDILMKPDSSIIVIATDVNSRIPYLIKQPDSKLYLTNASFPLPDNAIIQGKVPDQNNRGIRVSPYNGSQMDFISMKNIKLEKDGSFTCPIFLNRPQHIQIEMGYQTFYSFMEPGDTLIISGTERQVKPAKYSEYPKRKKAELIASEKKMSGHFSGHAAYNTMLSTEIEQYRHGFPPGNDILTVMKYYKERMIGINELLDFYAGKASNTCVDYFRRDCNYSLATEKLRFYNEIRYDVKVSDKNLPELDKTRDFFLDIDTLSILMNPYDWNSSYQQFIRMSQVYKQKRLGWAAGKSTSDKFPENFYFAKVSLRGYPMYSQMTEILDRELRSGSAENHIVTSNYLDFINNCTDPKLTEPLKKVYETSEQLQIGNQFPVKSFLLQDSSVFSLDKFNGKPICLILLEGPNSYINFYKDIIDKFSSDEIEFIFAKTPILYLEQGVMDSTILKKRNVTYINLLDLTLKSKLLFYQTRIFMLDKWFRITENNAEDPESHRYKNGVSNLEKSLRKTIEAKRYSKAEQTSMIKTAGWSFGSILFTFLIGFWIYRVRIRKLKEKEAAKRRIKELEIKAIRSQMNPHFIFNALNSIQSLINSSQFKEANIYLSKFAVLLRGVLNNSEKSRISLSDELQEVELYCQLEQLRFEFKFEICIDPELNSDLIEIPGMIIQPLAENVVVHGLSGKGALGKLDIQVKRQNGNLSICVSDNGLGLQSQKIDELSQKGFGLKLVEERINILNLDGKEAKLTIENRSDATGTIATLIIPID